jgi:hypothetical protein
MRVRSVPLLPGHDEQLGPGLLGPVTYDEAVGVGPLTDPAPLRAPWGPACEHEASASVNTTEANPPRITRGHAALRGTARNPTRAPNLVKEETATIPW